MAPDASDNPHSTAGEGGAALSPYQFAKQVEKAFEEYIRPMVQRDGGDVEIIDIKDNLVYCQLGRGLCQLCRRR